MGVIRKDSPQPEAWGRKTGLHAELRSVGDVAKEMDSPSILVEIGHGLEPIFYEVRAADRIQYCSNVATNS